MNENKYYNTQRLSTETASPSHNLTRSAPKWILTSSNAKHRNLKETKNNFLSKENPLFTENLKTSYYNFPDLPDKIILGTNPFTQSKTFTFMKYRHKIKNDYDKERRKELEKNQKFKEFNLSMRNSVCQKDKITFTNRTTGAKFRFFEEFKEKMTIDDIEFEKKIEYDEKIYEENMREKKNIIETLHHFEEDPELANALADYKYEFYKRKGFKTNNFNLSVDKDEFSLDEFSVYRQINNTRNEADGFRKKISYSKNKKKIEIDNFEHYQKKISMKLENAIERKNEKSPTFNFPNSASIATPNKKIKRKYTKQASNKNFMFWLDLNKSQRILLKMKNFLGKLCKLKIPLTEALQNNIFSKVPFQRNNSYEFIKFAKEGNYKKILELFNIDRFLIYEFDQSNQTALHWASKRGYERIVKFLLDNNADPNSRDIVDRNPLYYAVREKHLRIVQFLLFYGSLPWSTKNCDFNKLETLLDIKNLIKRAKITHIGIAIAPKDRKDKIWKEESRLFLLKKPS